MTAKFNASAAVVLLPISILSGATMDVSSAEKNITGDEAKAISVASQDFEKKLNVAWPNYTVVVNQTAHEFVVVFKAKSATPGYRGSPTGVPGFEVKVKKHDYSVVSSQFSR